MFTTQVQNYIDSFQVVRAQSVPKRWIRSGVPFSQVVQALGKATANLIDLVVPGPDDATRKATILKALHQIYDQLPLPVWAAPFKGYIGNLLIDYLISHILDGLLAQNNTPTPAPVPAPVPTEPTVIHVDPNTGQTLSAQQLEQQVDIGQRLNERLSNEKIAAVMGVHQRIITENDYRQKGGK